MWSCFTLVTSNIFGVRPKRECLAGCLVGNTAPAPPLGTISQTSCHLCRHVPKYHAEIWQKDGLKSEKSKYLFREYRHDTNSLPFRLKLLTPICETFWKYFWRCILGRWYTGGRSGPLWLIFGLFCWNSSFDKGIPDFPSWPHFINSTDQYAWRCWKWTVWINSSHQFKTNPHHYWMAEEGNKGKDKQNW